jgi:hypothetical protein
MYNLPPLANPDASASRGSRDRHSIPTMIRLPSIATIGTLAGALLLGACGSTPAALFTDPPGNIQPTYEGMADTCAVPPNGACGGCSVNCSKNLRQVAVCKPSVEKPPWTIADPSKRVPCFQTASCECR